MLANVPIKVYQIIKINPLILIAIYGPRLYVNTTSFLIVV